LFFNKKKNDVPTDKLQAITVSKLSETFNQSIQPLMTAYFAMSEAFVNWDTAAITKASSEFKLALDSLKIGEIQKDTLIYESAYGSWDNIKTELTGLMADPTIEKKREDFNMVSQNMYDFLRTIRYDASKLYFQECPMAFDDEKPGNWLSKTVDVRNPYLGTKHPKYKDGMLSCGGAKDTLNFITADANQK
jgi:Protein of unknown function (DUF3347)